MKKPAVIIAMAVLGTGSAVLWLLLQKERALNADLQARVKAMEVAQGSQMQPPSQSVPAIIDPALRTVAGSTDAPAATAAQRSPAATTVVGTDMIKEMYSTPEGRASMLPTLRGILAAQFPDLAKALNLTPQEMDKLLDLLSTQRLDLAANALGGTRNPASQQEQQRKLAEQQRAHEAEQQALLGGKYSQWQEYQETLPSRQQVSQLQTLLNTSGNPLSETQSTRLMTALAAEQKRITQETANQPAPAPTNPRDMLQQQLQRTSDNNRRFLDTASSQLTPQQLDSYQRMLDQQQSVTRMMLRSMEGQDGAQGRN